MRLLRLAGEKTEVVATALQYARSPWQQLRGLIGRRLPVGTALLISHCPQIHTLFLEYPITVAFAEPIDSTRYRVLHQETLVPWRVSRWVRGAHLAIEMHADSALAALRPGDIVLIAAALPD